MSTLTLWLLWIHHTESQTLTVADVAESFILPRFGKMDLTAGHQVEVWAKLCRATKTSMEATEELSPAYLAYLYYWPLICLNPQSKEVQLLQTQRDRKMSQIVAWSALLRRGILIVLSGGLCFYHKYFWWPMWRPEWWHPGRLNHI